MRKNQRLLYSPALRMKEGELIALFQLARDVADHVLPRLVIPPLADRDEILQGILFDEARVPMLGTHVARYWSERTVLIDTQFLSPQYEPDHFSELFPDLVRRAWDAGGQVVSVATIEDLVGPRGAAFRKASQYCTGIKLALRVPYDIMVSPEWKSMTRVALDRVGLAAPDCCVIADFAGADFSQPDLVSGILQAALEDLQEVGLWRHVIFQGSNYPEVNPAQSGGSISIPRNEWTSWCDAVSFDSNTAHHLVFGDYGADCAKMNFGRGQAKAIPHLRYADAESWLVERGADKGRFETIMKAVCSNVVNRAGFSGRDFCLADDTIFRISRGATGPGTAKHWRAINMNHHITRVVADVGRVQSITLSRIPVAELPAQDDMFPRVGPLQEGR